MKLTEEQIAKLKKLAEKQRETKVFKTPANFLLLSPHPDDESIGCGGFLCKYGKNTDIIILTDGALGFTGTCPDNLVEIRQNEVKDAMEILKPRSFTFLNLPDLGLMFHEKEFESIDLTKYDYVLIPNVNEHHPDHATVFPFVKNLIKKQNAKCILVEYEVWTPIVRPNLFIDITYFADIKWKAIEKYVSQTAQFAYVDMAKGINRYRGGYKKTGYVEAYHVVEE